MSSPVGDPTGHEEHPMTDHTRAAINDQGDEAVIDPLVDAVADAINDCDHSLKVVTWEERLVGYAQAAIETVRAWDEGER